MTLNPISTIIIDDGQFQYPVSTVQLAAFAREHGNLCPANYELFCEKVDHLMRGVLPGSEEMVRECRELADAGAIVYRPR